MSDETKPATPGETDPIIDDPSPETSLEGEALGGIEVPGSKPASSTRPFRDFRETRPNWDVKVLDDAVANGRADYQKYVDQIDAAVESIPDDKRSPRFAEFRETYSKNRTLNMSLLNEAVANGDLGGAGEKPRTKLRCVLKSLPQN